MERDSDILTGRLRELYRMYGYTRYKMNKFEPYDFYLENKDFLISSEIAVFSDFRGGLAALRPDVTLSIVKNAVAGNVEAEKVFYKENVYRSFKGTHELKEFTQLGLEAIGRVDAVTEAEVLLLAAKSLEEISEDFILAISHMGFVDSLFKKIGVKGKLKDELLRLIRQKNVHELRDFLKSSGITDDDTDRLIRLASVYGKPNEVFEVLEDISFDTESDMILSELKGLVMCLCDLGCKDKIVLDFSIINNMAYYNGVTFQGFVNGIPSHVLSGGRYDNLLMKFGSSMSAVGFAVYLDELSVCTGSGYDADVLLIYNEGCSFEKLEEKRRELIAGGESVRVSDSDRTEIKCRRRIVL